MISIVIPTYNYARFLPDAIDSALAQEVAGAELEVLVVDDGSTDETPEVLARYGDRIRVVRKANAGLSAARNTGMSEALHEWVIFLDSDDMLAEGAAAALWKARLHGRLPWAVVAGKHRNMDASGSLMAPARPTTGSIQKVEARFLVLRNRFAPAVLANRRRLLDLGGFDPALRASEDRDMWIRVAARHPIALLDQVTLHKRDHGSNMSRAAARQTAAVEQVLAKAFANPDLSLRARDKSLANAVCLYQSALMYSDAGDHGLAARQMLRSILLHPVGGMADAVIPPFCRLRGLVSNLLKSLRIKS